MDAHPAFEDRLLNSLDDTGLIKSKQRTMALKINNDLSMLLNEELASSASNDLFQGLDRKSSFEAQDAISEADAAFLSAIHFSPSQHTLNRILSYASAASSSMA